jgi:NAD(P)-dependent dehydrogenase (short-subunit alcohol dehydrogenase family)
VARIEADGGKALAVGCDVTDAQQVARAVEQTLDHFGRIDAIVNNAGIAHVKRIEDTTLEDWRASIDVNLTGSFLMCRAVWPTMVQQGGGAIINVSSVLGKRPGPNRSAYCAAKYGVIGLTESLAREGYGQKIRVNAICPGAVETPLFRSLHPNHPAEDVLDPSDVAEVVVFLAGPGSAHINGESIVVRKA